MCGIRTLNGKFPFIFTPLINRTPAPAGENYRCGAGTEEGRPQAGRSGRRGARPGLPIRAAPEHARGPHWPGGSAAGPKEPPTTGGDTGVPVLSGWEAERRCRGCGAAKGGPGEGAANLVRFNNKGARSSVSPCGACAESAPFPQGGNRKKGAVERPEPGGSRRPRRGREQGSGRPTSWR